jgi:hypothetical protein
LADDAEPLGVLPVDELDPELAVVLEAELEVAVDVELELHPAAVIANTARAAAAARTRHVLRGPEPPAQAATCVSSSWCC